MVDSLSIGPFVMAVSIKILVTGAAGRWGALVAQTLAQKGHLVKAFDLPTASFDRIGNAIGVSIHRGDLLDPDDVREACEGVDVVLHLAEAPPPLAKDESARVRAINVDGTSNIIKALEAASAAHLIFPSSVRVYGRTQHEEPPIRVNHPCMATDNYSEAKIAAESLITQSSVPYTILRVTSAYSPELYEFPTQRHPRGAVPFMADQRVEFMDREDLLLALAAAVENPPRNRILNMAGGAAWRMRGKQFVQGVSDALAVSGDIDYSPEAGCYDWYDTEESQKLLNFQRTDFHAFQRKVSCAFGYGLMWPHV